MAGATKWSIIGLVLVGSASHHVQSFSLSDCHGRAVSRCTNHPTVALNPPQQQCQRTTTTVRRPTTHSSTQLGLAASGTSAAAVGLAVSSLIGVSVDKAVPNIGILATLVSAAVLSNFGLVPPMNILYDYAWTHFLPGSLALLLLSGGNQSLASENGESDTTSNDGTKADVGRTMRRVGIPFVVGAIGSLVGCFGSFLVCHRFPQLWLDPKEAAMAGGCLSASYVGGSVNFFATARIIENVSPNLLGALVGADLVFMAVYFATMSASLRSDRLRNLFAVDTQRHEHESESGPLIASGERTNKDEIIDSRSGPSHLNISSPSLAQSIVSAALVSTLALLVVQIANKAETMLSSVIPGTACGFIALLTARICSASKALRGQVADQWRHMQRVAVPLSEFSFLVLFASIGISANLGKALLTGPACLWFSMFAISWHIGITMAGSLAFRKAIRLEDVLVASNALIGGPATAAAFAAKLPIAGMTVVATFWGVVGYATGTGIGVTMTRLLQGMLTRG